jgi:hypothetical protein
MCYTGEHSYEITVTVFWNVTSCSPIEIDGCFRETYILLLQSGKIALLVVKNEDGDGGFIRYIVRTLCMCVCIYLYICMYTHIYICTHIYVYVYIYIHILQNFQAVSSAHPNEPGYISVDKTAGT